MQLRVLWFSTVDLTTKTPKRSGTWIHSMYKYLVKENQIALVGNVCESNTPGEKVTPLSNGGSQYSIFIKKRESLSKKEYERIVSKIQSVLDIVKPDVLHIWGTEGIWCRICADSKFVSYKRLLEIQGLKFILGQKSVFYGGLDYSTIKKENGFLEFFFPPTNLERIRVGFEKYGVDEICLINNYPNVSTQSMWVRSILSQVARHPHYFSSGIILRDGFIKEQTWSSCHKKRDHPVLFSVVSGQPFKGIHKTIQAFSLIHNKYPSAELRIAGIFPKQSTWKEGAYMRYLLKLIESLGLSHAIFFLGNIDEDHLIQEMYEADVFIISSYIESYCLALAEGLSIGVPCVAPFTSALPELVSNGISGLLFPIGDYYSAASLVDRILTNKDLAISISKASSRTLRERINPTQIAKNQVSIYSQLSL